MEFRKLVPADLRDEALRAVGALLYETDPFIYPAMFYSEADAAALLGAVIRAGSDAMFRMENLYAAWEKESLAAILLWHKGRLCWDKDPILAMAKAKSIRLPDTFDLVCRKYFSEYDDASLEGVVSLINVCVDRHHRSRGIAKQMLQAFFEEIREESYELYCLEDNRRAVELYQGLGFTTVSRQKAFTVREEEIYSVKMVRHCTKLPGHTES